MKLQPLPGFDWGHVAWSRPDSPEPDLCAYCSDWIPDESVTLVLWAPDGRTAQFCDACMKEWWGFA